MALPQPKYLNRIKNRPSYLTDFRNIQTTGETANDNNPTTAQQFIEDQQNRLTDPTRSSDSTTRESEVNEILSHQILQEEIARDRQREVATINQQKQVQIQQKLKTAQATQLAVTSLATNTPAALWMTAWHTWFWLTFQIPLAFLSMAFVGLQAAVDNTWIGSILGAAAGVINRVAGLLGGDLSLLVPLNIALALHALVFSLCVLGIFGTMFVYAARGQRPFSGDRSNAKFGSLLLCFIGYSVPLLNLFPWIGFYIYTMWRSRR